MADLNAPPHYIPKVGDKVTLTDEFLQQINGLDAIRFSKIPYFIVVYVSPDKHNSPVGWTHLIEVEGVEYMVGRWYRKYEEK